MKRTLRRLWALMLPLCMLLGGCGAQTAPAYGVQTVLETVELEDEVVALSEAPPAAAYEVSGTEETKPAFPLAVASGKREKQNSKVKIDYSHTEDGYVMVCHTAKTDKRLKVQVKGPATTYTYNLTAGEWTVFPLSDGSGAYQVTVFENVSGTKYAAVLSLKQTVTLTDEFAPFLRPNQYVNYAAGDKAVTKATKLTEHTDDPLEMVGAIYDYVVSNLTYDKEKAATVKSGYLPELDEVLEAKKGICFDYAALMTGMLRSRGVPCKLVVGYAGNAYHAWISVWTEESGWVDGVIFFDGKAWQRMDPTFASSGKQSKAIMKYIGDGSNYTAKYLY